MTEENNMKQIELLRFTLINMQFRHDLYLNGNTMWNEDIESEIRTAHVHLNEIEECNTNLLEALEEAKGAVEWMAGATDSDPEDHERLELVNKAIAKAKKK